MKYKGQSSSKNNCFSISVYNSCVYKKIKPPSLKRVVKLIKRKNICSKGVYVNNIKNEFFNNLNLLMKKTDNIHTILNKGGIINFKWASSFHSVLCFFENKYKIIDNKKVKQYTFINYKDGSGNEPIYLILKEFKEKLKYNDPIFKGWYFI